MDTSALIAIVSDEPDAARIKAALGGAERRMVSAASWVELATVLVRKFGVADPAPVLEALVAAFKLTIVSVSPEQAAVAVAGYAMYGRGARHPARLNFGDCFPYALAKTTGEPLLFKGDDFTRTDIISAL